MAFVVEDGTDVPNANSLTSLEFADDYFEERSVAAWTGSDPVKQAALIRATDYVEGRFSARWKGHRVDELSSLSWPRKCIDNVLIDEIPIKLQRAVCEYAVRALIASLDPDPVVDPSGKIVVNTMKKIGPLEKHFQVIGTGQPAPFRSYPAADMLLAGYLNPAQGTTMR